MENNEESKSVCSSVFKSGENTTSKTQFTQKWIELINKIEKNAVLKKEASYDLVIMSIRAGEWKEKRKDFSYDSISFLP